ncbi:ShlB/FhaC/HecB family hemolysin secretion/activation protein [Parvibaculum sp.]|uniref:ShlB/FhaC/HecB family hemolysin secretion/activation protein n=1 Tax=Parvibaculum sp. TaxID=2024848 RepID=UPI00320E6F37
MRKANKITAGMAGLLTLLISVEASADAIERNLPPAPLPQGPADLVPPNALPQELDTVPLGPKVGAIVLLGKKDDVVTAKGLKGIDASRVADLQDEASQAKLAAYVGQPVTRRLIAEIEATVANIYRAKGLPFVAVLTPPQEISEGVLQFRIVDFTVGRVTASGNSRASAEFYTDRVRVKPGERVETEPLLQDLDWINRSNFHKAEAIFTPGSKAGETDLNLRVTEGKPWRVYAGYANSGAPSSTESRYFVGGTVGDVLIPDSFFSYQFTGSRDFWYDEGSLFNNARHPSYASQAARLVVPTAPRQQIEALFSEVETSKDREFITFRQRTIEGSIAYRSALSNFTNLGGDIYGGVEAVHQNSDAILNLFDVDIAALVDVYQVFAGWSGGFTTLAGASQLDVSVHSSPGGVGNHNDSTHFKNYSVGASGSRVTSARYDFVEATLVHDLPIVPGVSFHTEIAGQLTTAALPESQQIGIAQIRGYNSDDGSFDTGVLTRNEVRLPTFNALGRFTTLQDNALPYVFFDAGYAKDRFDGSSLTPMSAGAGLAYSIGRNFSASVDGAYAMHDAMDTKSGDWRAEVKLTVSY